MSRNKKEPDILLGITAGILGGLIGTVVMTKFQGVWSEISKEIDAAAKARHSGQGGQKEQQEGEGENSTEKLASKISEGIFGHQLAPDEKKTAGSAVHYAMGAVSGGIYGGVAEYYPTATVGAGAPFGASVWLVADEITLPLTGLSKPPTEYPPSLHAYSLAAHMVYGVATELSRRVLRMAF